MALSSNVTDNHYLLDEFKVYKNMDLNDSSNDMLMNTILSGVEHFFNTHYGIYLKESDVITKKFSVKGGIVILPSYNVNIISAKLDGNDYDISDLYTEGNILKSKENLLTDGIDNFELTYTLGFNVGEIPQNLKLALFIFTDYLYEKTLNNESNISSFSDPVGGREVLIKTIPKEISYFIAPYIVYNFWGVIWIDFLQNLINLEEK